MAAAIADNDESTTFAEEDEELSEDDYKLKDNVYKLLDMLVDNVTLKKFGWPETKEEKVSFSEEKGSLKLLSYARSIKIVVTIYQKILTIIRSGITVPEYVKLLFTVVIHNDSIKQLLNNYSIDEVIEHVLSNDDEGDDDGDENKKEKKTDKSASSSTQIDKTDNKKTAKSEKEKSKN